MDPKYSVIKGLPCICNKIYKILSEMKTVELQKHFSSDFSANLILAQVCIQNHTAGDVTRMDG